MSAICVSPLRICIGLQTAAALKERTLDDEIWSEDTHSRDTNASFSGTVRSTEACEHDSTRAAHRSEERLFRVVSTSPLVSMRPCVLSMPKSDSAGLHEPD